MADTQVPAAAADGRRLMLRLTRGKVFRDTTRLLAGARLMQAECEAAVRDEAAKLGLSPDAPEIAAALAEAVGDVVGLRNEHMMTLLEDAVLFFRERVTAAKFAEARAKKASKEDAKPKPVRCGIFGDAHRGGVPLVVFGTREAVNAAFYHLRRAVFDDAGPSVVNLIHPSDPFTRCPAVTLVQGSRWIQKLGDLSNMLRDVPDIDLLMCSDAAAGCNPKTFKGPHATLENRAYKSIKLLTNYGAHRSAGVVAGVVVEPGQSDYRKVAAALDLATAYEVEHTPGLHDLLIRDRQGNEVGTVKVFTRHLSSVA